ncbi:ATP-dependent DNA ligase [Phyllobacterium brassicacearum]|uniref:DNA ligase (ATP) n=1 Tax=Phyllobacterium brassicacearum TaxID=314235 RepID=A0A2P7B5L3_9HYPH|nr:non-homologous end-joining DNA ligase [Phyllobacterium brassicacearum]PSH61751.1 ATP-dependent DNA ligase [Phyllobacterium brassicacearum]TDQ15314.1 bifunctional non-homologous end joining protein LigD [Phyllobacterium brassicacearum]
MAKRPSQKLRTIGLLSDLDAPLKSQPRKQRDPRQPQLAFDPMPDRIEPCLALLKPKPPSGPDWVFEVKWDGYRLAVHAGGDGVRVITRGGHDWTHRFPLIAQAAKDLGTTLILDGEAVVLDEEGRSDFGLLQQALGGRGGKRKASEANFYAFDLLYFDGHDISRLEFAERRHVLQELLKDQSGVIRLSEEIEADGAELLRAACAHGLEGIIAKHKRRPYHSGRTGDWLKIKCVQSESFFIVGWEPSRVAFGGIGRLLLAAYKGHDLVYVGGVGTGFNERTATALRKQLEKLKTSNPAVPIKRKGANFVLPTLIAEIEFRAWTQDGKLRHPSYKGLREVQDNAAVYKI